MAGRSGITPGRVRSTVAILLAQVVNLGSTLLITRMYAPAAFGRFATLLAVAAVAGTVSSLRLDVASTTAPDAEAAVLQRAAVRLNLAMGGAVAAVAAGWDVLTGHPAAEGLAVGAVTAALAVSTTLTYARVRERRYGLVAVSKLTTAVVALAAQVALALGTPTAGALLVASAVGYGAGALLLAPRGSREAAGPARDVLGRHRGYMLTSAPAVLVNTLGTNIPVLATGLVGGSVAAGQVALALRIGSLPAALLGQALMPILFGEIAHRLRTDPAGALRAYDRALAVLSATGAVALTGLAVGTYAMAARVLGAQWAGVGTLLLLLLPFLIGQFSVAQLAQTLNAAGRNGLQFGWDLCRLAVVAASFAPLLAGVRGLHPAVVLFSASGVAVYGAHVLLSRRVLRQVAAAVPTTDWNEREHAHV